MDVTAGATGRVRSGLSLCTGLCVLLLAGLIGPAQAQPGRRVGRGRVVTPPSSIERPEDRGRRAHTNHLIFVPEEEGQGSATPHVTSAVFQGLSPAEVRAAYGVPDPSSLAMDAGPGVIAIVDAFDSPTAVSDFNTFSQRFGLPQEAGSGSVFKVVYASGTRPGADTGWSQEAALDVQWAHAMAPGAKIVLVEAASDTFGDLLAGVRVASQLPGIREVSMSWGGAEFAGETSYDSTFTTAGVVYFAASGDAGGEMSWPAASPNVVGVGGTTLTLDDSGAVISETGWSYSGGGTSAYEARPSYQDGVPVLAGSGRGVPDISFDADPSTGVVVCWQGAWGVMGGTSLSAPAVAGLTDLAASIAGDGPASGSVDHLRNLIYAHLDHSSPSPTLGSSDHFRDIVTGTAGSNSCAPRWDAVTGVGSPWQLFGAGAAPPPPPAPVASFTMSYMVGVAPLRVTFSDTSTNTPTAWAWSFGDGGTSTAQSPTYEYVEPGRFTVSLTATNAGGAGTKTASVTVIFPDVALGSWAQDAILSCVMAGIVSGYPDGSYAPTSPVTRDQMAVYVARGLAGGDADVPTGPEQASFPDVPTTHWAYRYIEYAKSEGIVTGYPDGSYGPQQQVDRGQMAVYIARAIADPTGEGGLSGYTPPADPSFSDVPVGFWARKYVEYIKSMAITRGYPDGTYQPAVVVTRDQMAVYIARAFGLPN